MKNTLFALCLTALWAQAAMADPLVQTTIAQGALRGVANGPVAAFLGIPYAAPPVGDNRWRAPLPTPAWTGEKVADHFSPACYQKMQPSSEDCLYINVWTPAQSKNAKLPVLFWIYGGGFNSGAGSNPDINGENLAKKGIIVVNFNYRVGAFGYLAHPELTAESPSHSSGNYGMLDVVAALKWVRANIASFGGDPNAITIGGLSSGAQIVKILDVSPLSRGLYARAIIESGLRIGDGGPTLKQAEDNGVKYVAGFGVDSVKALRAIPPDQILAKEKQGVRFFSSIYDGYVLPRAHIDMMRDGQFNKNAAILGGWSAQESTGQNPKADKMSLEECGTYIDGIGSFAPRVREAYLAHPNPDCYEDLRTLVRDRNSASSYEWAAIREAQGAAPVYNYIFDHAQPGPDAAVRRAFHGVEEPYVFNNLDKVKNRPFAKQDQDIADKVSTYWTNFVKTGNPNGAGLPHWPAASTAHPQTMELGDGFGAMPITSTPERFALMKSYLNSDEGKSTLAEGNLAIGY